MLIAGAKGFAIELLEVFHQMGKIGNIVFFDDVSSDLPLKIFNQFTILKSLDAAKSYFKENNPQFCLGLGNPKARKVISEKLESIGGILTSVISPKAEIGHYDNNIGDGTNIMTKAVITNHISIGKGVLINLSCTIGHDVVIKDFVELCPGVNISGHVYINANVFIGTNATILPDIHIGENSVIAAGAVVTKDVPANVLVAGTPAVVKKNL